MIGDFAPQSVSRDPGITVVVPSGLLGGCGNSAKQKRHDKDRMPSQLPILMGSKQVETIPPGKRAICFLDPTPDRSNANL
jgi:hypothetical protein